MKYLLLFAVIYSSNGDVEKFEGVRRYKPEWKDLDTRPLPEWYDRAKVGIFLHWGVYSVPAYRDEFFWRRLKSGEKDVKTFMSKHYPRGFQYRHFTSKFTAKSFKPEQWADLFKKAGARYVVITSKHHDGFKLFPSTHNAFSYWNAFIAGPRRDLIKDVATAVREKGLEFGVYYSLFEWFNPVFLKDKALNFSTQIYVRKQVMPDLEQLVEDYHPSIMWSDGDSNGSATYWNSTNFLAWLYNDSPVKDKVVVNDRWGRNKSDRRHGDFYNHADRFNPGVLQNHKWENAFTIDKRSWGYRENIKASDFLTLGELINNVVRAVSCGGNVLINVGPTKEGEIHKTYQKRLIDLGNWLNINGEAIYDTSPWLYQNDSANMDVWYTCKRTEYNGTNPTAPPQGTDDVTAIYAIILSWPKYKNKLALKCITSVLKTGFYYVEFMMGKRTKRVQCTVKNGNTTIVLPNNAADRKQPAWTLKFSFK